MLKAVIFDMDGLLIDSEPFWRNAHIAVVGEEGFMISEDDVRHMAGKGTSVVVSEWQQRFGWDPTKNNTITDRIVQKVINQVKLDGVALNGVDTVISLFEAHGIPMAVASSSGPELINAVLSKLGITDKMAAVHSGVHEKRSKPHPDVFLSTAQTLGVDPKECLVFEDSMNGVLAAKAAGMVCIAVPENPYDLNKFATADLILDSLQSLNGAMLTRLFG